MSTIRLGLSASAALAMGLALPHPSVANAQESSVPASSAQAVDAESAQAVDAELEGGASETSEEFAALPDTVTTTAMILLEGEATDAHGAIVSLGLRRGLAEVDGVRFVHPVDVLSPPPYSEDVQFAVEELEPLADQVRNGDARDAHTRASRIVELFEENLAMIRREQLIDAYLITATSACRIRRFRECMALMERVLVFREGHDYDPARYPEEFRERFDALRSRTITAPRDTLEIRTEPPGAEIYVDGRSYGPSPVEVPDLLIGDHYITIKMLGYERAIVRSEVERGGSVVSFPLVPNERAQLVASEQFQQVLRSELGAERAGENIRSLGSTLGAGQVIVAVVRTIGETEIHVQAWLYDVRTRFLLASQEATLLVGEAGMETARRLAVSLYRGVDLRGAIAAPTDIAVEPAPVASNESPYQLHEQWWFWTVLGVVVVAGGVATGVGIATLEDQPEGVPAGFIRFEGPLP